MHTMIIFVKMTKLGPLRGRCFQEKGSIDTRAVFHEVSMDFLNIKCPRAHYALPLYALRMATLEAI
jgi:hypothetical protein